MSVSLRRSLGLAGLLFVVLLLVSIFVGFPNPPSANASLTTIVSYYHNHKPNGYASGYVIALAVVVGLFFFWYLRDLLSTVEANRRLATVGFAGAVVFAVSGGVAAGLNSTLASAVDNVSPTTMQTLNVLQQNAPTYLGGAGSAVFLLATGIAIIRSGVLPRWLGWVGVVLGVLAVAVPFGPAEAGLWVLVASIVILVRNRGGASTQLGTVGGDATAVSGSPLP